MVPRTYPSSVDPVSGHTQMVAYMLPSVSGLTKWIDYIPVRKGNEQVVGGSYDSYIFVDAKVSQPAGKAWIDYIPVYEDGSATDAWMINAQGYIPYGSASIAAAIQAVRRNNGTMLYVPDNYAGAYVDSTGTQPVTAINDLVGLLTDRSYGASNLGPELVTNGDFSGGTTGWSGTGGASIAVTSGELVVTNTTNGGTEQALQDIFPQVAAGKTYVVSLSARKGTAVTGYQIGFEGSATSYYFSGGLSNTTAETKSFVFTFTSGQTVAMVKLRVLGLGTAIFDNISVREVLGNHASQGTTANKPLVTQLANGTKVMDFDASNDSLTIGMATSGTPWVRTYTTAGTVTTYTSATTTQIVMGQPQLAGRRVVLMVASNAAITGADLTTIEALAVARGAVL